jgi:hypothetical protein
MTTTTDKEGYCEFEVPPGSEYNLIVNGKEYNGKVYTSAGRARNIHAVILLPLLKIL